MFLTFLPQYLTQRFNFQLGKAGWLSMLPYLVRGFVLLVSGYGADWLIKSAGWRTVNVRMLMTVLPQVVAAGCTVAVIYSPNVVAAVTFLSIGVGLTGMMGAG